jgi:hypothetical protein
METLTETETAVGQATEEQEAKRLEIQEKFDKQEAKFRELESIILTLRGFFEKHREPLSPFGWSCYAPGLEITFGKYAFNGSPDPKAVASAFGSGGWIRKHNPYACGSIDWFKTVDGVVLKIEDAENIKPKLIEEVKL